jgi:hypothetical protein
MAADIIHFRPRANPKADRAFWIGASPIEIMAAEILKDEAFRDAAPSKYVAPDGDCA